MSQSTFSTADAVVMDKYLHSKVDVLILSWGKTRTELAHLLSHNPRRLVRGNPEIDRPVKVQGQQFRTTDSGLVVRFSDPSHARAWEKQLLAQKDGGVRMILVSVHGHKSTFEIMANPVVYRRVIALHEKLAA